MRIQLLFVFSLSAWTCDDWWEPNPPPSDLELGRKIQRYSLQRIEFYWDTPHLGPFTKEDILTDLEPTCQHQKVSWYVEQELVLMLENINIKNGTIKSGKVLFGKLSVDEMLFQAGNSIFSLPPDHNKENEYITDT